MKKTALLILILLFSLDCIAQLSANDEKLKLINKIENLKSGNYKDVLTSFFQLATTNFTGNEKTIEMNTTLFAIKLKANPNLDIDTIFAKERFSRNFQFNFKLNLDDKFKFKGFTGGATYAIINDRDKQTAVFTNDYLKNYKMLTQIISEIKAKIVEDDTYDPDKLENAINLIYAGKPNDDSSNKYYDIIITEFKIKANNILKRDVTDFILALKDIETDEFKKIDAKPLWTISADGSANTDGKFNRASFGTIFLAGNKEAWNELDLRAKLTYTDTLATAHLPRTGFNAKAGMNFKLAKGAYQQSYFEIKVYGEYNKIYKNVLPNEDDETILANADFRIRLTDDLWIPVTVKYDTDKANFLGFLNITYNFGDFKKSN